MERTVFGLPHRANYCTAHLVHFIRVAERRPAQRNFARECTFILCAVGVGAGVLFRRRVCLGIARDHVTVQPANGSTLGQMSRRFAVGTYGSAKPSRSLHCTRCGGFRVYIVRLLVSAAVGVDGSVDFARPGSRPVCDCSLANRTLDGGSAMLLDRNRISTLAPWL